MSCINVLLSIKFDSDEKESCGRNDYVLIFIEMIHQFLMKTTQKRAWKIPALTSAHYTHFVLQIPKFWDKSESALIS